MHTYLTFQAEDTGAKMSHKGTASVEKTNELMGKFEELQRDLSRLKALKRSRDGPDRRSRSPCVAEVPPLVLIKVRPRGLGALCGLDLGIDR